MSTKELRQTLQALAFNKRADKLTQKIQNQIATTLKEWKMILYDYVKVTTQLNELAKIAEQSNQLAKIRQTLKECRDLVKSGTEQFEKVWTMVEMALPISMISKNWMDSIMKYAEHLTQIKDALAPLLLHSSNRSVIEIVQKLMLQITDIQSKINLVTDKVSDSILETFQKGSDALAMDTGNDENYDKNDVNDDDMVEMKE